MPALDAPPPDRSGARAPALDTPPSDRAAAAATFDPGRPPAADGTLPPHTAACMVCGPDAPAGYHLHPRREGDEVRADFTFGGAHQGAPALAHGGEVRFRALGLFVRVDIEHFLAGLGPQERARAEVALARARQDPADGVGVAAW